MSTVNSGTRYDYNFHVDLPEGGQSDWGYTLWADGGVTDEIALYLLQAVQNAPWPAGAEKQFSLVKSVVDQTTYIPDLTAIPPVFV